jgi:hypothetical protein
MKDLSFGTALFLVSTILLAGCGSTRELQAVAISPAVADAQTFSNGEVSFTATGKFSNAPTPTTLTSADISWCVGSANGTCAGNVNPGATVDQNGGAKCVSGFSGTVTILAGSGGSVITPDSGTHLKTFGTAQLTCP